MSKHDETKRVLLYFYTTMHAKNCDPLEIKPYKLPVN